MKTKPDTKRSWHFKMHDPEKLPRIVVAETNYTDIKAGTRMLIASPMVIDRFLRTVPYGQAVTVKEMRQKLAEEFEAEATCALTTGIFLKTVIEYNYELIKKGTPLSEVAPFWRLIDPKHPIANKLSFGYTYIYELRQKEGIIDNI